MKAESPMRGRLQAFLLLACIMLGGCGYYSPYAQSGNSHIRVHHGMWTNRGTEMGLDNTLYQTQADWLRKSPLISLADSAATADYELSGSIDRLDSPEVSFGAFREGIEGRAELTVSFRLRDTKSGQVVWQRQAATRQETFYLSPDPIQQQSNRRQALRKIADDFAEEIYLHLLKITMKADPAASTL